MQAVRAQSYRKSPREPVVEVANKKLCRLSLLMEFNILFKRTIVDNIQHGCSRLCSIILEHGEQDEVVRFSAMASEDGVLGVLNFIAGRCNESLDAILTETAAVPLTPCLQRASDGSLALHIDAQRLFVTSSLLAGLACLFASFWVFHVVYPKKAHRILTFIEHCFLDLSYTKPRVKALELVNFYKNFC
ncbi:hypothetical protein HPB49_024911 [Dermacentor silvarum]|uniref:Uncharacterized protein n=1 Tax=Dermacentor silvarum TaxID=543639 RepID=A0ACB8DHH4_DERSI|nr:hypothetical protein HPB49_024911 [Dermacentor silvarum]